MIATIERPEAELFVAGVSYRTAPVEVRERLAVAHPDRIEVGRRLLDRTSLQEIVLLWTCNRVEIYGVAAPGAAPDTRMLFGCLGREAPVLASQVYSHRGPAAVEHLFRVAGGLDSMVLGETQITGQVKQAYEAAHAAGLTGKVLNRLFQKALQTAKEIRTRTSIGHGYSSVAGAAVAHAERVLGADFSGRRILVLGAGKMAACCLRHLQKRGATNIRIANRSLDRAQALAAECGGEPIPFDAILQALADTDMIVCSTGSAEPVLRAADVGPAMGARGGRPLVVIDIAVPRDVDPDVGRLPGVYLHDIDALESTVNETMQNRGEDLDLCHAIIERKTAALMRHLQTGQGRQHE